MDRHVWPLEMSDEEFRRKLEEVEAAFADTRAAFFWDQEYSSHSISVFEPGGAASDEEFEELQSFAGSLDQLMVFAFGDAPDELIKSWGDDHGDGMGDVAVARAKIIDEVLASARVEWESRFTNLGPSFADATTSLVYSFDASDFRLVVRMRAFNTSGPRRTPILATEQTFEAVMSRRDLKRLVSILEAAAPPDPDTLLEDDQTGEE